MEFGVVAVADGQAVYSCNEGYVLEGGAAVRTCLSGAWSESEVYCAPKACTPLPELSHGSYSAADGTTGDVVSITCDEGYAPATSASAVVCLPSGNWNDTLACVALSCPELVPPEHGRLTPTSRIHNMSWKGGKIRGEKERRRPA